MSFSTRSLALAAALSASTLGAQNMLTNGDLELGAVGWTFFGNAFPQNAYPPQFVPNSGNGLASLFGNFSGGFNVSGMYQQFPANAGDTFTIDSYSRHWSGDPLTGTGAPASNWVVMKMAFFDAGGTEIGGAEGTILDGNSPTDTWIDNAAVTGTAPAGTTDVQALILFLQPGNDGGAGHVDDIEFTMATPAMPTYPGTGDDLELKTGLGVPATGGPGNDVKQALPGIPVEVNVSSPGNTFIFEPYWVLCQPFSTGTPPGTSPGFPGLQIKLSGPVFLLVDGSMPGPLGPPLVGAGTGTSSFYRAPTGMAGTSVMIQGLVVSTSATNGYALTDGHEIQFQ